MEGVTVRTQDSDAEMRDAEQVGRSGVGRGPRQLLGDPWCSANRASATDWC